MRWWPFGKQKEPAPLALPPHAEPDKAIVLDALASVVTEGLQKARAASKAQPAGPKAWSFDPVQLQSALAMGYVEQQATAAFGFPMLRRMGRLPPLAAINGTRINQACEFTRPYVNDYTPGYRIKLRDTKRTPSKQEAKAIEEMTKWFEHCGYYRDPQDLYGRPTLEVFVRKWMRDSMEIDQACFEVLPDRRGMPAGFAAVDGSTIRFAKPDMNKPQLPVNVSHVQVIRDQIVTEWHPGELCLAIRRPMTDINRFGYGFPEAEELARIVTAWLQGFESNMSTFKNGASANGAWIFENCPEDMYQAAQQVWRTMLTGTSNRGTVPFFNVPEGSKVDFKSTQLTNKEMEFFQWLGWCYRLLCAGMQIDAIETGFQFGNEGQTSTLHEGSPAERIRSSLRRGLHPILRLLEDSFNQYLVWILYPELAFAFVGMEGDTEVQRVELEAKQAKTWMSLNMLLARHDEKPVPWGDVIADPVVEQARQAYLAQQEAKAQQEAQVAQRGRPGAQEGEGEEGEPGGGAAEPEEGDEGKEGAGMSEEATPDESQEPLRRSLTSAPATTSPRRPLIHLTV